MNAFWKLYKKEIRFLAGPGVGLILLLNIGGLLNAVKYVSPAFHTKNLLFLFQPITLTSNGMVTIAYIGLLLYAVVHKHMSTSHYQDFILPCRRSKQLMALLAAVVTWMTGIPILAVLLDVSYFSIHNLIPSLPWLSGLNPGIVAYYDTDTSAFPILTVYYVNTILSAFAWGLILCLVMAVAYIATILSQRLLRLSIFTAVLTGFTTIFLQILAIAEISDLLTSHLLLPKLIGSLDTVSLFGVIGVCFTSALLLYERYGEV